MGTYLLFEREDYKNQAELFGEDPYSFGIRQNQKMLDVLFRSSYEEGLTKSRLGLKMYFILLRWKPNLLSS